MNDLVKILEACRAKKYMTRLSFHPGGHVSLVIYNSEEQSRQYMYEQKNGDVNAVVAAVKKDFPKLVQEREVKIVTSSDNRHVHAQITVPSPTITLPPIPGFPRP